MHKYGWLAWILPSLWPQNQWNQNKPLEPKQTSGTKNQWNQNKPMEPKTDGTKKNQKKPMEPVPLVP